VDGRVHHLADYAASPVLVVVFTCNHRPIAQMYEERIQQLETDYRHRGLSIDGRHGEAHAAKGLTAFGTSLTRNRYF